MVVAVAAGQLKVTAGSAGVEVDRLWLHGGCGTAERQNRSILASGKEVRPVRPFRMMHLAVLSRTGAEVKK